MLGLLDVIHDGDGHGVRSANRAVITIDLHSSVAAATAAVAEVAESLFFGDGLVLEFHSNGFKLGHAKIPPRSKDRISNFFSTLHIYNI